MKPSKSGTYQNTCLFFEPVGEKSSVPALTGGSTAAAAAEYFRDEEGKIFCSSPITCTRYVPARGELLYP